VTTDPFPDVRWGSESSPLRRPAIALASTRAGSWLVRTATPLDRRLLLRSRGRLTLLGPVGAPMLLLTTTGAKSGLPRTTPLLYWRDAGRLYVVGSNFGQERHPAWSANLLADPRATVTIGGTDVPVTARVVGGEESARAWQGFVAQARTYAAYRERTDRELRVFALEAA
jgi:deazaflavin-dependent oxidoreductase (nitroreductase family)